MNHKTITPALAALTVFGAGHAMAQTAAPADQPVVGLEEVVVTAQRRSERAIDVPQTVNLVSEARLQRAGITDSSSLQQIVPGLSITQQGNSTQPTIRGIGSSVTTVGSGSTVATYIDGVYQISQGGNFFDLNNISKIEVLKGPQGTLYGRNSTGGVILITTKDPAFTTSGRVNATYGNYNQRWLDTYLTGPLTDSLAANLSLTYKARDGWVRDIARNLKLGDTEYYAARGKLLYQLSDKDTIVLALAHSRNSDPNTFLAQPRGLSSIANGRPGAIIPLKPYNVSLTFSPYVKNAYTQASVTANISNDYLNFRSITAANFNKQKFFADVDASNLPLAFAYQELDERVLSQELTVSSLGEGRFNWIGGLLYTREKGAWDPYVSVVNTIINTDVTTDSYSGFFEGTFNVTDRLKLVAGTRYTQESKSYTGQRNRVAVIQDKQLTSEWTPRISVNYKVTDDASVYATYSKGFRSGGWNASSLNGVQYKPEFVKSYEAGVKATTGQINFNAATFYYDYTDIQFSASTTTIAGGSTTTIINAAAAKIKGAEANIDYAVTHELLINAGLSYTDAEYKSFPTAIVTQPIPTGGNTQFVKDVSGNTMIRTPKWTANLGVTYTADLSAGELTLSGNGTYRSSVFRDPNNRVKDGPLTLIDARAAFRPEGKPYSGALWVRNLTDKRYVAYEIDSTLSDRQVYGAPRTYGVTLSYDF